MLLAVFSAGGQPLSLSRVVIDPGHGGTDPGAISRDGKNYEKTFTLDIATRLGEKIKAECPGVEVVMTRTKDKSVALNDRAAIANKAGAELFISIHINSASSASPNGYSVHVLGKSSNKNRDLFAYNMDVCKRENSVILLEDDYTTTYQGFDPSDPESFIFLQLMQNSNLEQSLEFAETVASHLKGGPIKINRGVWQDPFLVLWRTAMPAVLVELGFISNATDLDALKKAEDRDALASRLCAAFKEYKSRYDASMVLGSETKERPASSGTGSAGADASSGVSYGIQIFAGSKRLSSGDKAFLGYKPFVQDTGKLYKYVIAVGDDLSEVRGHLSEIRKKYPDAFLVKITDGKAQAVK